MIDLLSLKKLNGWLDRFLLFDIFLARFSSLFEKIIDDDDDDGVQTKGELNLCMRVCPKLIRGSIVER